MDADTRLKILQLQKALVDAMRLIEDLHGSAADGISAQEKQVMEGRIGELEGRLDELGLEHRQITERYVQLERQYSNFISLYVASTQLHSTLKHYEVLKNIKEIVVNLIGAEQFAIYLYEPQTKSFRCEASEGLQITDNGVIPLGDNLLSEVVRSGELYLRQTLRGGSGKPIAIQPLVAADQLVGALVLYKLLSQKQGFEPLDLELFELLAGHAATALMSSQLHTRTERKASTLEGLIDLLKSSQTRHAGSG